MLNILSPALNTKLKVKIICGLLGKNYVFAE